MSSLGTLTLYFLTQRGCSHCSLARPIVEQYRQENLGKVFVMEMDAHRHPQIDGWEPKATPAFALKLNNILVSSFEGSMSKAQIERFVQRGASGKEIQDENRPVRRRKKPAPNGRKASRSGGNSTEDNERESDAGADADGDDDLDHDDARTS